MIAKKHINVLKNVQLFVDEIFDEKRRAQVHHQNLVLLSRQLAQHLDGSERGGGEERER